jgi:hypothetical protein
MLHGQTFFRIQPWLYCSNTMCRSTYQQLAAAAAAAAAEEEE